MTLFPHPKVYCSLQWVGALPSPLSRGGCFGQNSLPMPATPNELSLQSGRLAVEPAPPTPSGFPAQPLPLPPPRWPRRPQERDKLRDAVQLEFGEACRKGDLEAVLRFSRLFAPLDIAAEGLGLFTRHVRATIEGELGKFVKVCRWTRGTGTAHNVCHNAHFHELGQGFLRASNRLILVCQEDMAEKRTSITVLKLHDCPPHLLHVPRQENVKKVETKDGDGTYLAILSKVCPVLSLMASLSGALSYGSSAGLCPVQAFA